MTHAKLAGITNVQDALANGTLKLNREDFSLDLLSLEPCLAAAYFLGEGFDVAPLTLDKHIPLDGEYEAATCDLSKVKSWLEEHRFNAGVAVRCHERELLIIDLDDKGEKHGSATWAALAAQHKDEVPETVQVRTVNGGMHLWFRKPADWPMRHGENALGDGIDIPRKAIIPPSLAYDDHGNLKRYTFVEGHSPFDVPIAAAPPWLLDALKDEVPQLKPASGPSRTPHAEPDDLWAQLNGNSHRVQRALAQAIGEVSLGLTGRNKAGFAFACALRDAGLPYDVAELFMERYQQNVTGLKNTAYPREEALTSLRGAYKTEARDDRLNIADQVSDLVDLTLKRLGQANHPAIGEPQLYARNGRITYVRRDERGRPLPEQIPEAALLVQIDRTVRYRKLDRRTQRWVGARPPLDVVRGVQTAPHLPIPPLVGITESPVLRLDGTIFATPGYDPATKLLYVPSEGSPPVPPIPEQPTDDQIKAAFVLLAEVLDDFPYHGNADRANAYAALLTPTIRPAISGYVPLAAVDSPKQGNGKSLFGEVVMVLSSGQAEGSLTEAKDDEEWRKKITATLRYGRAVEVIDNVRRGLDSAALASLFTKHEWRDRLLGETEMVTYPAHTTWLANGNNLRFGGDMIRRVYRIRLDAESARPWTKPLNAYRHPELLAWVTRERPRLLAAVLTIGRAWFARGRPPAQGLPSFANFNEWTQTLGGLLALGEISGFLGNLTELWDIGDDEAGEWEPFLRAWEYRFAQQAIPTQEIYEWIAPDKQRTDFYDLDLATTLPGDLADWLAKRGSFTRRLGWALANHKDTRYGNEEYRVVVAGKTSDGITLWRVLHGKSQGTK